MLHVNQHFGLQVRPIMIITADAVDPKYSLRGKKNAGLNSFLSYSDRGL